MFNYFELYGLYYPITHTTFNIYSREEKEEGLKIYGLRGHHSHHTNSQHPVGNVHNNDRYRCSVENYV